MKLSKTIIVLLVIISFVGCSKSQEKDVTARELNQEAIVLLTDLDKMDIDKALEHLNEAIRLDQNFVEAYLNRAQAHLFLDKPRHAFDDYNRAIQIKPNSAKVYFQRGKAYLSLEKEEKAFEDFDKALQLDPSFADPYFERGKVYFSLGVYTKAYEDFNQALNIVPNHKARLYLNEVEPFLALVIPFDNFSPDFSSDSDFSSAPDFSSDSDKKKDKVYKTDKDMCLNLNDGTVADRSTGKIWQKETDDRTRVWSEARSYCEGLTLAGYNDWIMPDSNTLKGLNIYKNKIVPISKVFETRRWGYWTSSTSPANINEAKAVVYDYSGKFNGGLVGIGTINNKNAWRYVRCVRNP